MASPLWSVIIHSNTKLHGHAEGQKDNEPQLGELWKASREWVGDKDLKDEDELQGGGRDGISGSTECGRDI